MVAQAKMCFTASTVRWWRPSRALTKLPLLTPTGQEAKTLLNAPWIAGRPRATLVILSSIPDDVTIAACQSWSNAMYPAKMGRPPSTGAPTQAPATGKASSITGPEYPVHLTALAVPLNSQQDTIIPEMLARSTSKVYCRTHSRPCTLVEIRTLLIHRARTPTAPRGTVDVPTGPRGTTAETL